MGEENFINLVVVFVGMTGVTAFSIYRAVAHKEAKQRGWSAALASACFLAALLCLALIVVFLLRT